MPAPLFTTNPSEFGRLEGVYIFEKDPPSFIEGVFLGTVGIVGLTLRGPVDTPVEITSGSRFEEVFGQRSYFGQTTSVNKVREFMMNKPFGKRVIVRVAAAAAATAEMDFLATATPIINVAASSPGAWGNDLTVAVEDATDGDSLKFDLVVNYRGDQVRYANLNTQTSNDNLLAVIGSDLANHVVVTKLADGRPDNAVAAALTDTAGSDGAVADTDYTATDRGINQIKGYRGVGLVAVADRSTAAIKSAMHVAAQASSDRLFLIWNGSHSETLANVVTDAALYRSDRIVYVENSTKTFDFDVAAEVELPPHSWMASILSSTDVDINPGEEASKEFTAGITGLRYENREREDYISLKEAGVASFEKDEDGGFLIVSGVVNDLTTGKTQITRRRSADLLQLSAARRLRFFLKKKNTAANRAQLGAEVVAFLNSLKDAGRIVEDFTVEQAAVNTEAERAKGRERILMRVKLIGHILSLILETEIGETVILRDAA